MLGVQISEALHYVIFFVLLLLILLFSCQIDRLKEAAEKAARKEKADFIQ